MAERKASTTDNRARHWSFIVYPESAPPNWRDIIDDLNIEWVESPLHDKDVDGDGEGKKPHWHILVTFEGKKSFEQIKEITDSVNAPIPQKAASAKGLVRYMIHLDNPEKHQYERSGIIAHGGADVAELLKPTSSSRHLLIGEMQEYIVANSVTNFVDLAVYAQQNRPDDWYPLLCDSCAYFIGQLIKSVRYKLIEQKQKDSDARRPEPLTDDEVKQLQAT